MMQKKFDMTSNTRHDIKNTSLRLKVCSYIKGILTRLRLRHVVTNFQSYLKCQIRYTNLTFLRYVVLELSTIVYFSQLRWSWPFPVIFRDNIKPTWPSYLHVKLCNNQPNFNEVTVWYMAANTHIHIQTHTSITITSLCEITDGDSFDSMLRDNTLMV